MTVTRLRADALRNRERIVEAAREALVRRGYDVALDEIAREAGVGNATLYRHFADREALVRHVVLAVTDRLVARGRKALDEEPDSFEAVRTFAFAAAEERVGALCSMLSGSLDFRDPDIQLARSRLERLTGELLCRARHAGAIREGVDSGDLLFALTLITRPLPDTGCAQMSSFAERHLQLLLDGMRAPARSELPGRGPTLEDFVDRV